MQSLLDNPRYATFIKARDRALERVHQNTQVDLSRILYKALEQVEGLASSLALKAGGGATAAPTLSHHFEMGTKDIFSSVWAQMVARVKSMRKAVFILTYASEQEAIGRATQRSNRVSRAEFKLKIQNAVDRKLYDNKLDARVWLNLMKLRHRVVAKFESALIQELAPHEIVAQVTSAFPKIQDYRRPPKALSKVVREANHSQSGSQEIYDYDFIDDADWNQAVDAYTDTELPASRFDNGAAIDPDTGMRTYQWEMEQDATEDFVNAVRSGQVDAANDLGVKDFVWVAILDDKTDSCCQRRHGKTTAEIQAMLDSGALNADTCDATVPPAHPNCRCQIGPVASTDEVQGPDWDQFNEWLQAG